MKINLFLTDRRYRLQKRRLINLVNTVLSKEKVSEKSLNIIYCSDRKMIELNRSFKGKNDTTDVLSFAMGEEDDPGFLGETYINLQQARRQAKENDIQYQEEVERLTIHGVLHLLGYSDVKRADKKKMWKLQESYLQ